MMVLLVCFGAAIAEGSIFGALSWRAVALTTLVILIIRPAAAWICLAGGAQPLGWR